MVERRRLHLIDQKLDYGCVLPNLDILGAYPLGNLCHLEIRMITRRGKN